MFQLWFFHRCLANPFLDKSPFTFLDMPLPFPNLPIYSPEKKKLTYDFWHKCVTINNSSACSTGLTASPSDVRPTNPTPGHADGVGTPTQVRPTNPTPARASQVQPMNRPGKIWNFKFKAQDFTMKHNTEYSVRKSFMLKVSENLSRGCRF